MMDSFGCIRSLELSGRRVRIAHLPSLEQRGLSVSRLPYSMRILLENLLRREDGRIVTARDIEAVARWRPGAQPDSEIAFMPARVLLQDFTGVPAVADLAAMRDAMRALGGVPARINPLQPAELVIDHSVQVDEYGSAGAFQANSRLEFERNRERYAFLRWGQSAFRNFRVVPPSTGIVHQVNLEYLARVVMTDEDQDGWAYPDTLVGTDSHTTMINGLGVLGWGVGGIEAEAAMLGQPISMLVPEVVGLRFVGAMPNGTTATDLVLTVTQRLREYGVVGKFVEFHGPGLPSLTIADRATIANMAPEYGATCGFFPVDAATLEYLRLTGRPPDRVAAIEVFSKEQGLFHDASSAEAVYSAVVELDLAAVVPSLAGPRRPQDRVPLTDLRRSFERELAGMVRAGGTSRGAARGDGTTALEPAPARGLAVLDQAVADEAVADEVVAREAAGGQALELRHGSVVIAAITSCTNTSNPAVMVAAGLLARKAVEFGLETPPWVKTSLAPGSKVVTNYLREAGLTPYLERLGFHLVGYGCTTCIGNSGPLRPDIAQAVRDDDLVAVAVLSGNRNFEGRISPDVRANFLASPPLVVAFALAGRIDIDLYEEPLGTAPDGTPIYLKDVWPSGDEVARTVAQVVRAEMFEREYRDVFAGDQRWNELETPQGETYRWDPESTYVRQPPFFDDLPAEPPPVSDLRSARVLAVLGHSVTTDHISPAGSIDVDSPAGHYLIEHGVAPADFNSYGSRRGNHEVMMRGTFANVRLRNHLLPGVEGGFTRHFPSGERMTIFDAAMRYRDAGVSLVLLAGQEYGTGSSRDWAAKGPLLLGVRAVLAESYERIHRSNLVGMGIAPLEFERGESVETLGLTGEETFDVVGLSEALAEGSRGRRVKVVARSADGAAREFEAVLRLDTPQEVLYFRNGGILNYVLRQLRDRE
ncbi:MAG TPA: aconitate hydratase AcnA [Thermoanaerobaculia bacterium]|nr:aconitate hydratase AcnA [Thermoanaerobaculia bacterium]